MERCDAEVRKARFLRKQKCPQIPTLQKFTFENNYYILLDGAEITPEEMLEEPVNTKWTDEETEISKGEYEYQNVIVQEVKNRVKGQKWEFGKKGNDVVYIKPEDISTEVINKKPVTKMIYDEWNKFFVPVAENKQITTFGQIKCEKKKDYLSALGIKCNIKKEADINIAEFVKPKREVLNNVYYQNETEWYDNENAITKKEADNIDYKDDIRNEMKSYSIYDFYHTSSKSFTYFNPLPFLHHLDKVAGMDDFNPYEGMTYNNLYLGSFDEIYNHPDGKSLRILSNPGMTTLYFESADKGNVTCIDPKNGFKYSKVNGFFNAQYLPYHTGYTEYWHEGIDFRGKTGATVVSLINGRVIRCGERANKSDGGFILLQSLKDENLYFLALHVDAKEIFVKNDDIVTPNMSLAKTMFLSDGKGGDASHLHVSAIKLPEGTAPDDEDGNGIIYETINSFPVWGNKKPNQACWKKMINPFNYEDKDTWQGRY